MYSKMSMHHEHDAYVIFGLNLDHIYSHILHDIEKLISVILKMILVCFIIIFSVINQVTS